MGQQIKMATIISKALQASVLTAAIAFAGISGVQAQDSWSYTGTNGPKNWHKLSPSNSLCRTGQRQSPINIEGTDPVIMHRLITDYKVAPINMKNNRHSITMAYSKGSILRVGLKAFTLKSISFHTPAEHTVSGEVFPMSIQFKHQAPSGDWAIIETLVKEGKENLAAQEFLANLPLEPDQNMKQNKVMVNARDLMPTDKAYYRYMGSLSTPPCSENVSWYVLKKPIQLSKSQIELMKGVVGSDSARPLQARNNRMILDARPQ
jgi:carbonic anhydrase